MSEYLLLAPADASRLRSLLEPGHPARALLDDAYSLKTVPLAAGELVLLRGDFPEFEALRVAEKLRRSPCVPLAVVQTPHGDLTALSRAETYDLVAVLDDHLQRTLQCRR